jgi:hypothetical protein
LIFHLVPRMVCLSLLDSRAGDVLSSSRWKSLKNLVTARDGGYDPFSA